MIPAIILFSVKSTHFRGFFYENFYVYTTRQLARVCARILPTKIVFRLLLLLLKTEMTQRGAR